MSGKPHWSETIFLLLDTGNFWCLQVGQNHSRAVSCLAIIPKCGFVILTHLIWCHAGHWKQPMDISASLNASLHVGQDKHGLLHTAPLEVFCADKAADITIGAVKTAVVGKGVEGSDGVADTFADTAADNIAMTEKSSNNC